MSTDIVIQYIIIALLLLGAVYFLWRYISRKFLKKGKSDCEKNCGCS
ncbi:MAG: FeoB-associated Cys-rich membrane protein [Chryseobacterium sp.]|nr:MAG: FeoB-associated Cys-rich membrane protein [Chryseobacterium sp.]